MSLGDRITADFTNRALRSAFGACACACAVAASPVEAQEPAPPRVDTTKITVVTPVTVTGRRELAIAPPVSTVEVSKEAVQRAPASNPYDLVGRSAGIEVHQQGQGPGFASNVVIGGFTSDHSSDVLLVLDGVPINLPIHGHVEGYADWSILLHRGADDDAGHPRAGEPALRRLRAGRRRGDVHRG